MKFHTLKVSDIKSETEDCVSIGIEVPANLKKEFSYIQGQYLTLKYIVKGEELRRSYSICSAPSESTLRIAVKKVKDGRVSSLINDKLKVGDKIETMVPVGNFFTELKQYNKKVYNLFAAGSGITPIISILKAVLETESQSKVNLFYGNRDEEHVIFKKEIEELKERHGDRLKVNYIFSRPKNVHEASLTGRIDKEKVLSLVKSTIDLNNLNEFFVCGPTELMDNAKDALTSLTIPKSNIHLEYFGTPPDAVKSNENSDQIMPAEVTIICDGEERVTFVEPHQSVLEAALELNLDAPFACRSGSCCTCRAKVIEGKAIMDVNYALLDSEVEEGYILTCQAHPITATLTVDYDQGT